MSIDTVQVMAHSNPKRADQIISIWNHGSGLVFKRSDIRWLLRTLPKALGSQGEEVAFYLPTPRPKKKPSRKSSK